VLIYFELKRILVRKVMEAVMARTPRLGTFNTSNVEAILEAVRRGATPNIAAYAGRVSRQTLFNWLAWGEEELENGETDSQLAQFVLNYREAEWHAASEWLDMISASAPEDWRAAAWLLERRHPREYGRSAVEVVKEGDQGQIESAVDAFAGLFRKLGDVERGKRANEDGALPDPDA